MEIGDVLTWNGTVSSQPSSLRVSFISPTQIPIHIRQDMPNQHTIFNNAAGALWGIEVFGPPLYQLGQPFQISMKLDNSVFRFFSNDIEVYQFPIRNGATWNAMYAVELQNLSLNSWQTNWLEMNCIRSPTKTKAPRTRRPGHGHGDGHNGGYGHGGGYGGGRFSSSDSSESCEY
ncbi:hypothetical protein L3Y34_019729 [Caenorhabditis briggsae]|uniref:Galectin n=1 Tax=Caenorhabditis briggsae TaxID=6238 RepID=A0AAE9IWI0_CAEBR|nr:hypothetical protein L3Y34_019729 [Caenorhabditis briggsae]